MIRLLTILLLVTVYPYYLIPADFAAHMQGRKVHRNGVTCVFNATQDTNGYWYMGAEWREYTPVAWDSLVAGDYGYFDTSIVYPVEESFNFE